MNKWQETVKRVAKLHPGKSLREILPIAKKEYKKMGHHVSKTVKKGRKGRRSMKGGSAPEVEGSALDGGSNVTAFDDNWKEQFAHVGQRGGSKRRGSKRRGRGRGSKRRGRGSKRRGSKRRGRGSKRSGSKRRGSKRR